MRLCRSSQVDTDADHKSLRARLRTDIWHVRDPSLCASGEYSWDLGKPRLTLDGIGSP